MKILTRVLLHAIFILVTSNLVFAQLTTDSAVTSNELASKLVGSGVTISNITLNCPNGAYGTFNALNTNLGMDSGIILACGSIHNAIGPNISGGITTQYLTPGDPDLDALSGGTTNDACVLEFDVKAAGDSIKFNYVFGSDEYSEWVFSFNDIFAFLISGPGITGVQNIALVPGTSNPVSINNVNCQIGSPYYICNDPFNYACGTSYNCPTSSAGTTLEYDGFTTVLTAVAVVQPCQTYHLKLAIADALDWQLDSGVFLEAGSLSTAASNVAVLSPYTDPATNQPAIVEGCFDGSFEIQTCGPVPDSLVIHYTIGGTAINGTDYVHLADSAVILPGDSSTSIIVDPLTDAINEGAESVTIYLQSSGVTYDSATIIILDSLIAVASDDTTICVGQSAQLNSNGADSWLWSPSSGLNCNTCQSPIATPLSTTTYTVTIMVGGCTASDEVKITVDNPIPVSAGADAEICVGQSVQLNATNATTYTWSPATGLSSSSVPNPTATPTVTTSYIVTGVSGCFTTTDTVTVLVHPLPNVIVSPDVTVCPGTPVDLFVSGGVTYNWFPPNVFNNANSANPTATVNQTTTLTAVATDQFGCTDSANVIINIFDIPDITVSSDTVIYLGNSYAMIATGGVSYQWSPATGLDATNTSSPIATPTETTTYTVTITTADGCIIVDSVKITVIYDALVNVASGFSPNGDNNNDILHVIVRGIFHLDHFYIFNRWGEMVFQTNDVNIGWDGKYKNELQGLGVYVYTVDGTDAKGNKITKQGNVTLVR